jgi:uncharacterized protein
VTLSRHALVKHLTWLLMLGAWLGLPDCHAQVPIPPLTGHIVDLTHTLSQAQQKTIEEALAAFEVRKGSQLAVLLVPSTQPETVEQFALRVAEQWKVGRQKIDDGAILVVAKNDRAVRIEVGYGLEGALNDATCKRIIEEVITPSFRQQDFSAGIFAGVQRMMQTIETEALPAPALAPATPSADMTWIIVAGALFGFILRILLGRTPAAVVTAGLVGTVTWLLLGVLSMALTAGAITFLTTWLGITGLLRMRYGDRGRPGAGGFGGGGASGKW